MTENIKTLLSDSTTDEEKINAANNIIINYNLNLTIRQIMLIFIKARLDENYTYYSLKTYTDYGFLFEFLLNRNISMFIAMTKCCEHYEETRTYWTLSWCVSPGSTLYVGSNHLYPHYFVVNLYKNFIDHNNFNIDNLRMTEECEKEIQEYRSKKYGGSLTKAAKK